MAHDVMTDVNVGSERELVAALSTVPQLSVYAAQRIVQLRPFRDRDDMLNRVNAGCPVLRNRLSGKTAKRTSLSVFSTAHANATQHTAARSSGCACVYHGQRGEVSTQTAQMSRRA